eukprot:755746-Hanusia_phi.AAC.2
MPPRQPGPSGSSPLTCTTLLLLCSTGGSNRRNSALITTTLCSSQRIILLLLRPNSRPPLPFPPAFVNLLPLFSDLVPPFLPVPCTPPHPPLPADLAVESEPCSPDSAVGKDLLEDPLGGVDGDAEAEPLRACDDGGVDPDDLAAAAHQRASRVARVKRHVGLDHILDHVSCHSPDAPPESRDDAGRDGGGETEWVADGDSKLSHLEERRVSKLSKGNGSVGNVGLTNCQVCLRVCPDHRRCHASPVRQSDLNAPCVPNDVGVAEEVAVGGEEDPRARALSSLRLNPDGDD